MGVVYKDQASIYVVTNEKGAAARRRARSLAEREIEPRKAPRAFRCTLPGT